LVTAAAEWAADLVVVGSNGRSALGRLLLGSVSQMVLHNAPCSVRIGRCPAERQRPLDGRVRLVLGIDGSVDSATAVSAVSARHWPAGTEVLVVGVLDARVILNLVEFPPPPSPSPRDMTAEAFAALSESLGSVCEELRRSGLTATASVLTGDPKKVLLHEAERVGADCIFVGAKGHGLLDRVLLGSVSGAVAARAHCSVEVVRHG
jgi:nucleotide-binding universal stress UspA family protein